MSKVTAGAGDNFHCLKATARARRSPNPENHFPKLVFHATSRLETDFRRISEFFLGRANEGIFDATSGTLRTGAREGTGSLPYKL